MSALQFQISGRRISLWHTRERQSDFKADLLEGLGARAHFSRKAMGLCECFVFFSGGQLVRTINQFEAQEVIISPLTISNSGPVFSLAVEERQYVVKVAALPSVQPQAEREVDR